MSWLSAVVVYVVLWWLVLFCVLPLRVKPAEEGDLGFEAGAPAEAHLTWKALVTTAIATVLFGIVYLIIVSDWISFREP